MSPWRKGRFLAIVTGLVALGASTATWSLFGWAPVEWRTFESAARNAVVLPAIVVAVVSARMGAVTRRASVVVGPLASRTASEIYLQQARTLIPASLVGYLLGLAPAFIVSFARSTYGGPNVVAFLGAAMSLVALTCFALTVGHAVATRFSIVLTPLITLAAACGPGVFMELYNAGQRSLLQPAIVWLNGMPWLGWEQTSYTSGFRILYFALFAGASTFAGLWIVNARRPLQGGEGRFPRALAFGLTAALTATTATAVFVSAPLIAPAPAAPVCMTQSKVEVCMHPSQRELGPRILRIAAAMYALTSEPGDEAITYLQAGTTPLNGAEVRELPAANFDSATAFDESVAQGLARDLSGYIACSERVYARTGGQSAVNTTTETQASMLATAIEDLIASRAQGTPAPDDGPYDPSNWSQAAEDGDFTFMERMTNEQFHEWYTANRESIQSCNFVEQTRGAS